MVDGQVAVPGGGGFLVGLLGPVELGDGRGGLAPVRQALRRILLAMLAVAGGRVLSPEVLIDALWGEESSRARELNLHSQVSGLRRDLVGAGPGGASRLVRVPGGYRLVLGDGELDVAVFRHLARLGRDAARDGDHERAAATFRDALGLWRGPTLADVTALSPRLAAEARDLDEQRLAVLESRLECDLATGRAGDLVAELTGLHTEFPLRERLAGQLMLALYRSGRRGEALAVFDRSRRLLASDLGLDPGPDLAQMQRLILADDSSLALRPAAAPAAIRVDADGPAAASGGPGPGGFAAATRTLPRAISSFVGRTSELADLERAVTEGPAGGAVIGIHAIGGMAGIGKTTFAVHAAHRLAGQFPDGQFFLPLHAHTAGQRPVDPADALASLLMTAGVAAHRIPPGAETRAAVWRDYVAGKQILLVLDDAAGHEQVRPLLPGTPGSLVLITSRRRLTALEEAAEISLDTLSPGEAAALLARLAGRPELASGDGPAAEITRLCGYLPLAIGMLARQLGQHRSWASGDLAARLAASRDRLSLMHAENLSVAAAFDLSYADLAPDQQRLFRRLGLVPGPDFDAYAAAALDGSSLEAAWRNLDGLFGQHLLTEPAPGRYLLHDLLREHARALAAAGESADAGAAERLLDYYAYAAATAGKHIATRTALEGRPPPGTTPGYVPDLTTVGQAAAWLEAERPNLHAAVVEAIASGMPLHAVAIAGAIGGFLRGHGYFEQAAGLHQTALAAARQAADRPGQASAYDELGFMAWLGGDNKSAAANFRHAKTIYQELGDRVGEANAINHVALVQWSTGDYSAATVSNRQALALAQSAGDPLTEAIILRDLAVGDIKTGNYRAGEARMAEAIGRLRAIGDRPGQCYAVYHLSDMYLRTGDYGAAAANATEALQIASDLHDRPGQAWALNRLGMVQQQTGEYAAAQASHQQALEWLREIGQPFGEADVLNSLGELATRTSATGQARDYHAQALAIARQIDLPAEEARAYEGIGRSHLQDRNHADAVPNLRHALRIYQRIGSPDADRAQDALRGAAHGDLLAGRSDAST